MDRPQGIGGTEGSGAIIEPESNYLLNPLHPDFTAVVQADPRPFRFDVRLVQP